MAFEPAEEVGDEEGMEEEAENQHESEGCERVGSPEEDEFARKALDPEVPSDEKVERHRVMGPHPVQELV
eukprot:12280022-Karenia_brevis.AAC.1